MRFKCISPSFKEVRARLRAHQQQLRINQVFKCFSTLLGELVKMREGIGAMGGKYRSCHVSTFFEDPNPSIPNRVGGFIHWACRFFGPQHQSHQLWQWEHWTNSLSPFTESLVLVKPEGQMIGDHSQYHLLLFGCTKYFQAFRIVASRPDRAMESESKNWAEKSATRVFLFTTSEEVKLLGPRESSIEIHSWTVLYCSTRVVSASSQLYTLMPPIGQFRRQWA